MNCIVNIANLLSLIRILLTPWFCWLLLQESAASAVIALIVFTVAALTDLCDGYLARELEIISEVGNFLDPIADKVLILGAFVSFWYLGMVPLWFVVIVLVRDLIVTKLRALLLHYGCSLQTSQLGKYKTFFQFIIIYLLFGYMLLQYGGASDAIVNSVALLLKAIVYGVAVLIVYSGWQYCWNTRGLVLKFFREHVLCLGRARNRNIVLWVELLATVGYVGYFTRFPGSVASAITCVAFFFLSPLSISTYVTILVALFIIGSWVSELYELQTKMKDPSCVVIDEVVGMGVALLCVPQTIGWYLIALCCFRLFDITKIFPISWFERKIPGGLGVMVDDVAAGICACVVVQLLLRCF